MSFKSCKELQTFLKTETGLKAVFIDSWEGSVQPPYIVISEGQTDTVPADNKAYAKEKRFYITVFIKKSDDDTIDDIEEILDDNDIYYGKETFWLNDLRLECHEYSI